MQQFKDREIVETPVGKLGIIECAANGGYWVEIDQNSYFFKQDQLKKPETVKAYDGVEDVIIKGHQEALQQYPPNLRAVLDMKGRAAITGACYATYECGCSIKGNGTLQFPLSIEYCEKHKKVN